MRAKLSVLLALLMGSLSFADPSLPGCEAEKFETVVYEVETLRSTAIDSSKKATALLEQANSLAEQNHALLQFASTLTDRGIEQAQNALIPRDLVARTVVQVDGMKSEMEDRGEEIAARHRAIEVEWEKIRGTRKRFEELQRTSLKELGRCKEPPQRRLTGMLSRIVAKEIRVLSGPMPKLVPYPIRKTAD